MNKRLLATALSLVMAISLCGCGEKDKGNKKKTTTSATTTTTATTTTKTVETEPKPEPVKTFDLEGFEMGEAKQIGENKNLSIVATMDMGNLKYNGEEKNSFKIRKITDDNILLSLYFSDDDENLTEKLVLIDKETYEFIEQMIINSSSPSATDLTYDKSMTSILKLLYTNTFSFTHHITQIAQSIPVSSKCSIDTYICLFSYLFKLQIRIMTQLNNQLLLRR